MCVAGLTFGFLRGWKLAFAITPICPFIMTAAAVMGLVIEQGFLTNLKAYGQSAGYADQALNAIRVVSAFGQE
jgi:ABC-type multidrug transport system fused ATPase/permease subunit